MKKGISIKWWRDLEDGHVYNVGDAFPHDGREVSDERIAELSGTHNKAGYALIKAIKEETKEIPTEKPEAPKTTKKPRKTATKK